MENEENPIVLKIREMKKEGKNNIQKQIEEKSEQDEELFKRLLLEEENEESEWDF